MAHTTDQRQFVDLEALSWATAIAEATPAHLGLDLLHRDLKARRQTLEHDDKTLPV
jgi:hypothetical protein